MSDAKVMLIAMIKTKVKNDKDFYRSNSNDSNNSMCITNITISRITFVKKDNNHVDNGNNWNKTNSSDTMIASDKYF